MAQSLEQIADDALSAARAAGADDADVLTLRAASVSVDVRAGALEQAERAEATDVGLRVMVGNRQACVAASDTRADTLAQIAARAVAMARAAPPDPYCGLADPDQLARDTDMSRLELSDPSTPPDPARLQDLAARAEAAALDVPGVTQVSAAAAQWQETDICLAATNGFSATYRRSSHALSCVAIAGDGPGMERDYDGDARVFGSDLRAPDDIGRLAGTRAVERLSPRKPPTGAFPVLFDERVSATLIGHVLAATNGASVARGSSWLREARGEQVLPSALSLTEEPHRPRVSGSRLFDAEGLPTAPRSIIRDGVLCDWTLDLSTARRLGLASTGNAARGTGGPPSPSSWNVSLTQGDASRADLIRDMGTGLLITSLIGSTISPTTGDYSRGASGFWVENGVIAYPVNECTVAGNLRDFLLRLTPANDARPWLGRVVPSLLVEGLTLAGG